MAGKDKDFRLLPLTSKEVADWEAYSKDVPVPECVSVDTVCLNDEVEDFDEPDFEKDVSGQWAGFRRVGHGVVTNGEDTGGKVCGTYYGKDICDKVGLHDFVQLNGERHTGKVYWVKKFRWCDKPDCPVCFKRGWAVKEARAIDFRIEKAEFQFGKAEHLCWSPAPKYYGLSFEALRAMMFRDLKACRVIGGVEMFHMERFSSSVEAREKGLPEGWRISLHWHILGFIDGGYSRCRSCKKSKLECLKCDGFDGCARRVHFGYVDSHGKKHDGDGAIISVKGERKTIFGSAWYQLNHATMRVGVSRQRVARWFGCVSYRALKLKNEDRYVRKCPWCASDLQHGRFVGEGSADDGCWSDNEGESDYLDERGVPRWIVVSKHSGASGGEYFG